MVTFSRELRQLYEHPKWDLVIRPAVFKRDHYTCQHCKVRIPKGKGTFTLHLTVDHLCYPERGEPLSAYLKQPISQMQTLCNKCHKKKTKADRKNRKTARNKR